ncbi:hypothetical protein AC578_6210 [Pseudocercospora eumusae]|uniref:C2H2-type domain-containing protein n=1 Tax=Pseudocercospora eumusae TaxID=321146 RepID=A0A139H9Z5_9PEZI|nr:hypothetical protein AC578_6210 [Pseudocercospora eumusae]
MSSQYYQPYTTSDQSYNPKNRSPNYVTRTLYPTTTPDTYASSSTLRSSYYDTTATISPSSTYSTSPTSPSLPYSSYPSPTSSRDSPIYYCLYPGCEHGSARKADLERHVQVTHLRESLNLVDCQYVGCHRKGKYGFTRKDKMVDHMRDVHKADIPKRKSSGGSQGGMGRR